MQPRTMHRALTAIAVVGSLLVIAAFVSLWWRQRPLEAYLYLFMFHNGPPAVLLLWMSRLVLLRRPGLPSGVVLLAIGALFTVHVAVAAVADSRLVAAGVQSPADPTLVPAELPLDASVPLWVMSWLWVPGAVLAVTVLLLIFPDGRLPGRRWRLAIAAAALGMALLVAGTAIDGWPTATWPTDGSGLDAEHAADLDADTPPPIVNILLAAGALVVAGAAVAGIAAVIIQWRRAATPEQRYPFHLVAVAAGAFILTAIATYPFWPVWATASLTAFYALLAVYALAVARYRVHDLEPFLGKAAAAKVLSLLVVAVYAATLLGVGALVSRRSEHLLMPLLAVIVVAAVIEPVRRWAGRLIDRAIFGRHADRTDVMSRLTARSTSSPAAAAVLTDSTELLVRSTGAARAEAWLELDGQAEMLAASGPGQPRDPVLTSPLVHGEEHVGELRLFAHSSIDLAPDAAAVLADVANVVSTAMHSDRLARELAGRLDQVQALSRRLVEAQDEARRGLERDLHDGVQARLLSIRLRVGAAHTQAATHGDSQLADDLGTVGEQIDATVTALRDLGRGLDPPILRRSGIRPALMLHAEGLGVPVFVDADGLGRYEPAIENAVYFACMEAVQNAVRHSGAGRVDVRLTADDVSVTFVVTDDGTGFDPSRHNGGTGLANMHDRIAALRGNVQVDAVPGRGTRVTGVVPGQSGNADR